MTRPGTRTPPRLAGITPDRMSPAQAGLYRAIIDGPRGVTGRTAPDGSLRGPFNAMLLSPPVGDALQQLGGALRFRSLLPARRRELVILVVAAHRAAGYEWRSHRPLARQAGVPDGVIEEVARGHRPLAVEATDAAAVTLADALLAGAAVADDAYATWRSVIGETEMFEIAALVGYYRLLADQLTLFGIR